ncbi:MAG: alpha/beta hydrolase family protein [Candidatus Binatia bacterium]
MKAKHERRTKRFKEQRWVLDYIIKTVGVDWDQGRTHRLLSYIGVSGLNDVTQVRERVAKFKDIPRELEKVAKRREEIAKRAEDEGRTVTARENYFMAALFYSNAQWGIFEDDNGKKIHFGQKQNHCYDKYIKYADHKIERVEIPFEGKSIPGLLHLPTLSTPPYRCVLSIPGMDSVKEDMPLYGDPFLAREMAVLRLDGPGQGESNLRKIRVTEKNYDTAGKNAVDYLTSRDDIDKDKIALHGVSMGTYWGFRVGASDKRFKAVALSAPCLEPGMYNLLNTASPTFKLNYLYRGGYYDEDDFDEFAKRLDVRGLEKNIKAPFLLVTGEDDELCPLEYTYEIFQNVPHPKKLIVYEGEKHSLRNPFYRDTIVDWMKERLDGKPMKSERVYVEASGREIIESADPTEA